MREGLTRSLAVSVEPKSMIIFLAIAFTSLLMPATQSDSCNLEREFTVTKGQMLTASNSDNFSTYTILQCHDLCRRLSRCKAFMFQMKYKKIGERMKCTVMFDGVETKNGNGRFCNKAVCFISGFMERKTAVRYC